MRLRVVSLGAQAKDSTFQGVWAEYETESTLPILGQRGTCHCLHLDHGSWEEAVRYSLISRGALWSNCRAPVTTGTQPHVQTNKVKRFHPQALQKALRILCWMWDTNMKPQIANSLLDALSHKRGRPRL